MEYGTSHLMLHGILDLGDGKLILSIFAGHHLRTSHVMEGCYVRDRVTGDGNSQGYAIVGVLEADFIEPPYDKLNFERRRHCYFIGHQPDKQFLREMQKTYTEALQTKDEPRPDLSGLQIRSHDRTVFNNDRPIVRAPLGFDTVVSIVRFLFTFMKRKLIRGITGLRIGFCRGSLRLRIYCMLILTTMISGSLQNVSLPTSKMLDLDQKLFLVKKGCLDAVLQSKHGLFWAVLFAVFPVKKGVWLLSKHDCFGAVWLAIFPAEMG
ncbi:microrchidia 2-like protein [Tanacetum coccineum]